MQSLVISVVLLAPVICSVIVFALGRFKLNYFAKLFALISSFGVFVVSLLAFIMYESASFTVGNPHTGMAFKLVDQVSWISQLNISYFVGVDMLSLPLVILSTFVTFLAILSSWDREDRVGSYFSLILLLETGIIGAFVFLDMFFFFIAWEIVLVPMFFLIGIWGGEKREYAAIYFFIYTHVASLILLLSLLGLYLGMPSGSASFSIFAISQYYSGLPVASVLGIFPFIFAGLLLGFMVKVPSAPFHTWLPLAHVEAPSPISMILAGLLLKMGGYGILRFNLEIFPQLFNKYAIIIGIIGLISLFWGGFVALKQTDLKRLVAYSSIAHMGLVLFGAAATAATGNPEGVIGAEIMMLAHGLISPMLFNLCGTVQHSTGTRQISSLKGITQRFPAYAALLTYGSFASLGLPALFGFVSEFFVFLGAFSWNTYQLSSGLQIPLLTFIAIFGIVVTVSYYLWMLQRVVWGKATETIEKAHNIHMWEYYTPVLLMIPILIFGIFPRLITDPLYEAFTGVLPLIQSLI
ncbi:MAG: NuoM family protein [Candidatus Thorarchaeota archaeon]